MRPHRVDDLSFSWFVPTMTTQKQIDANRKNAQKSTGPKSNAGKTASSRNALKLGVLSQNALADHEDSEAYSALLEQLINELGPESALECTQVERLSILIWREKRIAEAEAELMQQSLDIAHSGRWANPVEAMKLSDQHLIGRYQGMLGRQIRDTLRDLRDEQDRRLNAIEVASKA